MLFGVWLSVLFGITPTLSARILGIVPTPSYSHQIVFRPLWRELSLRGHQVTVLTSDPMKDPSLTNLTEIDLHFSYKTWNDKFDLVEMAKLSTADMLNHVIEGGALFVAEQLQHPAVQNLFWKNTERFDVALIEPLFPAMVPFAEKFNCPLILINSLDGVSYLYHLIGNPSHPVSNPEYFIGFPEKLNFFQRLSSTFISLFLKYYFGPRALQAHQAVANKYFGNNYSTLEEILANSSMMFVNTNVIFHRLRPLLPNIVQIGCGMHLTAPKPLPKDLQNLLDEATNGIIYFSLGSNVKSNFLPEHTRKALLETFAELPYIVLWKFEQETLLGKPDNVIISQWFPQQDILRHPNVKLFITQGGLQSVEEAIYNHVPIVGIPFAVDQRANIQTMVEKGVGFLLDFDAIEKDSFRETILEVINNPVYRAKAKELAELTKDQPMSGLESAVWWTEYVIRHKGANHLKSPALDLPSYQYYLLDVIIFCVLVILTVVYILIKLVKLIYNLIKKTVGNYKLKKE